MEFWQGKIFWESDMESFSCGTVYFQTLSEKWYITITLPICTPLQVFLLHLDNLFPIQFQGLEVYSSILRSQIDNFLHTFVVDYVGVITFPISV